MPDFAPLEWQREALQAWRDHAFHGVASVVTGAGKTIFALLAYKEFRKVHPGGRLLVIVPTLALLDQWEANVLDLDIAEADEVRTYSGEGKPEKPGQVNIALINTARTWAERITSEGVWMVVVDECHRAATSVNSRALPRSDATLGLSATPIRQYDDGFERYLLPMLGPLIFEYTYRDALRDKIVAPFELHNFEFELAPGERAEYEKLTKRIAQRAGGAGQFENLGEHLKQSGLDRLLFARARVLQTARLRVPSAVALVERFPGRTLVFHERIDGAEAIGKLLDKRRHRVATYHSGLSSSFRQRNLRLFRRGEIDVLVTCRALDEGLNVPDAETAIVASSTKSTRQRIQRLGRVLRATPGKTARVATLYATDVERSLLLKEAEGIEDLAAVRWYSITTQGPR